MKDYSLAEDGTILLTEDGDPLWSEESLAPMLDNYKFVTAGDGISVSERVS